MSKAERIVKYYRDGTITKLFMFDLLANAMSTAGWDDAFETLSPAIQQEFRDRMMPVVMDDIEVVGAGGEAFSDQTRAMLRQEFKDRGWM